MASGKSMISSLPALSVTDISSSEGIIVDSTSSSSSSSSSKSSKSSMSILSFSSMVFSITTCACKVLLAPAIIRAAIIQNSLFFIYLLIIHSKLLISHFWLLTSKTSGCTAVLPTSCPVDCSTSGCSVSSAPPSDSGPSRCRIPIVLHPHRRRSLRGHRRRRE